MTVSSTARSKRCRQTGKQQYVAARRARAQRSQVAVDKTAIPLHPPLPLSGVSIVMERERRQTDSVCVWYACCVMCVCMCVVCVCVCHWLIAGVPPSIFSRCINRDGESASAE